ncbi:MAG: TIGR03936 family radical SAM-associated protein [Clostridia bacterium]|nr:TIGR03936 family radical SAM-associated protein [Clostridia bacterium]
MRIIARFSKGENVRFVSHLDVQRLFHRALMRAGLPVEFSNGYNPHPLTSFATALSVGVSSEAEWLEVRLKYDVEPQDFLDRLNASLPNGFRIEEAFANEGDGGGSLSSCMVAAEYALQFTCNSHEAAVRLTEDAFDLLNGPIVVTKRTKRAGSKEVDIRPGIFYIEITFDDEVVRMLVVCELTSTGGTNPELLVKALMDRAGMCFGYRIHRKCIYSADGSYMPKYHAIVMPSDTVTT